ncbi:MAG: hypothetical protein AB8B48_17710 [Pseudomonadales bacterium]
MERFKNIITNYLPWFSAAQKESGTVDKNVFAYITPGILITIVSVLTIIGVNADQLKVNFDTNVVLNSVIILIFTVAVVMSVWFQYRLWQTSQFMHRLDDTARKGECSEELHSELMTTLKGPAKVLDTKNMAGLLNNLTVYGHLNITDNDARLIKSKMGFRVSKTRSRTGFLSGLLVMLGLLGTFWGLLLTIDAVGEAMGSMASITGDSADGMSDFIAGIAAPLKGMGVAFSSSLFGLSGSLLTGFFSYLCGTSQDKFIETASRWIDERIPSPSEKMKKAAANPQVAGSDELKAWLAGFVQTSQITQRKIGHLMGVMSEASETSLLTAKNTQEMLEQQASMAETLAGLNGSLQEIHKQNTKISKVVSEENAKELLAGSQKIASNLEAMNSSLVTIDESNQNVATKIDEVAKSIAEDMPERFEQAYNTFGVMIEQIDNNVTAISEREEISDQRLRESIQPVAHALQTIDARMQVVAGTVSDRLEELLDEVREKPVSEELSSLLNNIVDGLNSNQTVQNSVFDQLRTVADQQVNLVDGAQERAQLRSSLDELIKIVGSSPQTRSTVQSSQIGDVREQAFERRSVNDTNETGLGRRDDDSESGVA